ncbi:MAG: two-component regulator propeller domain-containing protein [Bacteroidota bacterium]
MKWAICLPLLILSLCLNRLQSQNQSFLFNRVGEEESWGNHYFNDIVQDHYGFIWFATYTGLYKYDGANTTQYGLTPSIPNSLKSTRVTCLFIDSQRRLWVGTTSSGVFRYNYLDDAFIEFPVKGHIRDIVEGRDNVLYVGTDRGVAKLEPENGQINLIHEGKEVEGNLSSFNVTTLAVASDGNIWVGTECGLNRVLLDQTKGKVRIDSFNSPGNEGSASDDCFQYVSTIHISSTEKNTLWIGTAVGLYKIQYDPKDLTKLEYQKIQVPQAELTERSYINTLFIEDPHRIWIGANTGLKLIDPLSGTGKSFVSSTKNSYCISNNNIRSFCKDRFGKLWIGTAKGVNKLNLKGNPFSKVSVLNEVQSDYRITGVAPSSFPNEVWISSRGGGIYLYDFVSDSVKGIQLTDYGDKELGRFISSLTYDNNQNVWLATLGGGVIKVDEKPSSGSNQIVRASKVFSIPDGLAASHIMSIYAANDKNIWFGYWRKGLGRIHSETQTLGQYIVSGTPEVDLQEYHFTCMTEDDEQHLWAGTSEKGAF